MRGKSERRCIATGRIILTPVNIDAIRFEYKRQQYREHFNAIWTKIKAGL